jgi:hypothetical protein
MKFAAIAIIATTVVASGCDQKSRKGSTDQGNGRWAIVASQNPLGVWRMDTKTGELQYCRQDNANVFCSPSETPNTKRFNYDPATGNLDEIKPAKNAESK